MADLSEVLAILKQIREELPALIQRSKIQPGQITVGEGLSDISKRLGVVTAGEFRVGNGVEPGLGFSGVRIGYPAFSYASSSWHIAGINNDVIQFGLDATTGKAIAGGGVVTLDSVGLTFEVGTSAQTVASAVKWKQSGVEFYKIIGYVSNAAHSNLLEINMNRITGSHSGMQIAADSVTETISGSPAASTVDLVASKDGTSMANILISATSNTDNIIDMEAYYINICGSSNSRLGFFGAGYSTRQTVTGSRGANAALASLLTALASYGLIIDSSS